MTLRAPQQSITADLMDKCTDDVIRALKRALAIAPEPHLPIAAAAGAAVIGVMAGFLEHMAKDRIPGSAPDSECVLLAGLLCARMALDPANGVSNAYRDLEILRAAANGEAGRDR